MSEPTSPLVHTDEGALVESTHSTVEDGSPEPGPLSSAVERRVHIADVVGSIPTVATTPKFRRSKRKVELSARDMEVMRAHGWEVDEALERTNPKNRSGHYAYVVSSYGGNVKIGHSSTPRKRLSALQNGSPVELLMHKTWKLDAARAKLLERQLHTAFSWAYAHGEWFDVSPLAPEAVGDLFVAGRLEDALRLSAIIRQIRDQERAIKHLREAWYRTPGRPRERRDAEMRAKKAIPAAERHEAALWLEAFALGYTGLFGEKPREIAKRREQYESVMRAADATPRAST